MSKLNSWFRHFIILPSHSTSIYHKWFHSLHSFSSSALCIEVVHFVYLFQCLVCSPSSVFPMRNVLVILTPQTVSRKSRNQDPVIDKGTYTYYVIYHFWSVSRPLPPLLSRFITWLTSPNTNDNIIHGQSIPAIQWYRQSRQWYPRTLIGLIDWELRLTLLGMSLWSII